MNILSYFFHQADQWSKKEHLLRFALGVYWSVGDSYTSTLAFGASDSGKTSGAIRFQTMAMLEAGYGMLFMTAKETPSDVEDYLEMAKNAGRENSIVLVGPNHGLGFNILRYEIESANRDGSNADLSTNVASLMFNIGECFGARHGDKTIWRPAGEVLLRHTITSVYYATNDLSIDDLCAVIATLPQNIRDTEDAAWQRDSFCWKTLEKALHMFPDNRNLRLAKDYLLHEFPCYPPDTRNSVVFMVKSSGLDLFSLDPLYSMFFSRTDYTPDILRDGAIIICDCSVSGYEDVGKLANTILRTSTQRMLVRRGKS